MEGMDIETALKGQLSSRAREVYEFLVNDYKWISANGLIAMKSGMEPISRLGISQEDTERLKLAGYATAYHHVVKRDGNGEVEKEWFVYPQSIKDAVMKGILKQGLSEPVRQKLDYGEKECKMRNKRADRFDHFDPAGSIWSVAEGCVVRPDDPFESQIDEIMDRIEDNSRDRLEVERGLEDMEMDLDGVRDALAASLLTEDDANEFYDTVEASYHEPISLEAALGILQGEFKDASYLGEGVVKHAQETEPVPFTPPGPLTKFVYPTYGPGMAPYDLARGVERAGGAVMDWATGLGQDAAKNVGPGFFAPTVQEQEKKQLKELEKSEYGAKGGDEDFGSDFEAGELNSDGLQPNDWTCAPAAISYALEQAGIEPPEFDELVEATGANPENGVDPETIKAVASDYTETYEIASVDELIDAVSIGDPVIIAVSDIDDAETYEAEESDDWTETETEEDEKENEKQAFLREVLGQGQSVLPENVTPRSPMEQTIAPIQPVNTSSGQDPNVAPYHGYDLAAGTMPAGAAGPNGHFVVILEYDEEEGVFEGFDPLNGEFEISQEDLIKQWVMNTTDGVETTWGLAISAGVGDDESEEEEPEEEEPEENENEELDEGEEKQARVREHYSVSHHGSTIGVGNTIKEAVRIADDDAVLSPHRTYGITAVREVLPQFKKRGSKQYKSVVERFEYQPGIGLKQAKSKESDSYVRKHSKRKLGAGILDKIDHSVIGYPRDSFSAGYVSPETPAVLVPTDSVARMSDNAVATIPEAAAYGLGQGAGLIRDVFSGGRGYASDEDERLDRWSKEFNEKMENDESTSAEDIIAGEAVSRLLGGARSYGMSRIYSSGVGQVHFDLDGGGHTLILESDPEHENIVELVDVQVTGEGPMEYWDELDKLIGNQYTDGNRLADEVFDALMNARETIKEREFDESDAGGYGEPQKFSIGDTVILEDGQTGTIESKPRRESSKPSYMVRDENGELHAVYESELKQAVRKNRLASRKFAVDKRKSKPVSKMDPYYDDFENQMFQVSRYYEEVTPESAEVGDFSDSGVVYQGDTMDSEDLLRELREFDSYDGGGRFSQTDGYIDPYTATNRREMLSVKIVGAPWNNRIESVLLEQAGFKKRAVKSGTRKHANMGIEIAMPMMDSLTESLGENSSLEEKAEQVADERQDIEEEIKEIKNQVDELIEEAESRGYSILPDEQIESELNVEYNEPQSPVNQGLVPEQTNEVSQPTLTQRNY